MKIKNAEKLAALCLAAVMGVSVTACSGGNMYATSNESATIADNDVITIGSVTTQSRAAIWFCNGPAGPPPIPVQPQPMAKPK